jgi:hypothetical protein
MEFRVYICNEECNEVHPREFITINKSFLFL